MLKKANKTANYKIVVGILEDMYAHRVFPAAIPDKRKRGATFHVTADAIRRTVRKNKKRFSDWAATKIAWRRFSAWNTFFTELGIVEEVNKYLR